MTDKTNALKLIIEEQRRDYDYLQGIYERAGTKENALLAAAFAVVAYLYYNVPDSGKPSIAERLSIPTQDYGKVIYFMAAAAFAYGLMRLILNVFGKNLWQTAYMSSKNDYTYDETETLEYVKKRYDECHQFNLKSYSKRQTDLTFCFYCILLSAIILIVIKTLK